jgi:hypothetical protein
MGEFNPIHWLIVLAVIVLLFGGRKMDPGGFAGSPPTHALPVTSPMETSRGSGNGEKNRAWRFLIRFLRPN